MHLHGALQALKAQLEAERTKVQNQQATIQQLSEGDRKLKEVGVGGVVATGIISVVTTGIVCMVATKIICVIATGLVCVVAEWAW